MSRGKNKNDLYVSWSSESSASSTLELGIKTSDSSSEQQQQEDDNINPLPEINPQQIDFYSYSGDADDQAMVLEQQDDRKYCSRKRLLCFLIVLVLFMGTVAAGIILDWNSLAANSEESDATLENDDPTVAPTKDRSPTVPSTAPAASLIYEPPSPEDCVAIAKGDAVEGQEQMLMEQYEVDLDVALDFGGTSFDALLNRLAMEIRQTILPELAGCADSNRQLMEVSLPSLIRGGNRQLNARYAIANAAIELVNPLGEWCAAGSGPLCYRVVVTLNVALKGDVKVMTVLHLITEAFGGDSLAAKLKLGSPFQQIVLKHVLPTFSTPSPSFQPTF
jgi:hypothetical protein